jgi:sterol 14-demethylase
MRFAKLEVKIILALFLTRFEYSLVDAKGEKLEKLPEPYRDNLCVHTGYARLPRN